MCTAEYRTKSISSIMCSILALPVATFTSFSVHKSNIHRKAIEGNFDYVIFLIPSRKYIPIENTHALNNRIRFIGYSTAPNVLTLYNRISQKIENDILSWNKVGLHNH